MENFTNVEQVVNNIRSKYDLAPVNLPAPAFGGGSFNGGMYNGGGNTKSGLGKAFESKQYTGTESIDLRTNYTRLNSGDWIPKYENVLGSTGNEERLASQQSAGEQWFNGISKNLTKAGNYAVDATIGTAIGLVNLASGQGLAESFNNDFSKWIDDLNTQLDSALPNYYSEYQKNQGILSSMGTANFWANDFAGGLAFIGGNLISEAAIAVLTGGVSLATTLPRIGLKLGGKSITKSLAKTGLKSADDLLGAGVRSTATNINKIEKGEEVIKLANESYKNFLRSTTLGKVGKGLDLTGFAVRSSTFEAGMESRHALKESVDTYIAKYKSEKGTDPTLSELSTFIDDATNSANYVFMGNMAVLAPSNLLMFGKLSGVGAKLDKSINNFGNKLIGVGRNTSRVGGIVTETAIESSKFGVKRNLGRAYKLLGKASTEGLFEEGLQGVASGTMQNYLEDKYNPNGVSNEFGFWNSLSEAAHEQYTSKEGWKEMFIGALIGGIGGPMLQSPKTLINDVKSNFTLQNVVNDNQNEVDALNKANKDLFRRMNSGVALKNSVNKLYQDIEGTDVTNTDKKTNINFNSAIEKDAYSNFNYFNTVKGIKNESETLKDYDHMVDNMEISPQVLKETGMSEEQVYDYKNGLKETFRKQYKDFAKAQNAVKALGIGGALKTTDGNNIEVDDVLTQTVFMGMQSIPNAQKVASQLDDALGTSGIFNPLQFFATLSDENQKLVSEFKELEADIRTNDAASRKIAEERLDETAFLNYAKNVEPRNATEKFGKNVDTKISELEIERLRKKEQTINESLVRLRKDSDAKQERLNELKTLLSKPLKTKNFGLEKVLNESSLFIEGMEIESMLQQLDDVDTFIEALKSEGKTTEAKEIENSLKDFKQYSVNNMEFQKLYRKLLDPRFFKTKGGKGLINTIIGPKHELSEYTIKKINENDERILNSLKLNGISYTGTAEDAIKLAIQENPNLSEREKFRLEAVLRATLMQSFILEATNSADNIEAEQEVTETTSDDLGQPDSIEEATVISQQEDTRTNSEQLKDIIQSVIGEINKILKLSPDSQEILSRQDIKRLNELIKKEQSDEETLTQEEIEEMRNLQNAFDQWTTIDGTTINKIPLSSLIKRQALYEETIINSQDKLFDLQDFDTLTLEEFSERVSKMYYNLLQSYFTATSIKDKKTGKVSVQGVTIEKFAKEIGHIGELEQNEDDSYTLFIPNEVSNIQPMDKISEEEAEEFYQNNVVSQGRLTDIAIKVMNNVELNKDEKAIFDYRTRDINALIINLDQGSTPIIVVKDERGNIVINPEDIALINNNTNLIIKPTNRKLSTNYSLVLRRDENGNIKPLDSDFSDFTQGFMNEDAVYNLNPNDEVKLVIDANDSFNKDLLSKIKPKKVSDKKLEEIEEQSSLEGQRVLRNDEEYQQLLQQRKSLKGKANLEKIKELDILLKIKEDLAYDNTYNRLLREATLPKISKELRTEIMNSFVVQVQDSDDNFVGVLKGIHESENKSKSDYQFEAIRAKLVDENLEGIIMNPNTPINVGNITVKDIYLGFPNYIYTEQGNEIGTSYVDFTENDMENIIDIGYVQNGEVILQKETKNVDKTFVGRFITKKEKAPVVVINFKGKKVLYPVKMKQFTVESSIEQMEEIFNGSLDPTTKAMHIDKILASVGIDINEKGNSLEYFSEDNNNFDNFDNLVAKVRNNSYFYAVDDWLIGNKDMKVALEEAQINIDTSKPFHSPKLTVGYENLNIEPVEIKTKASSKNSNNQEGFAYSLRDNVTLETEVEENKPNEICPE